MRTFAPVFAAAALVTATTLMSPAALSQEPPIQLVVELSPQTPAYSDTDARAVLNARLAALRAVVDMTPEQEMLWAPLEAAIRAVSRHAAERRNVRLSANPPADFLEVLGRIADTETARGGDLRRFVDSATPFVASLTDAQKRRIPAFLGMTEAGQPSAELWLFEEEEG